MMRVYTLILLAFAVPACWAAPTPKKAKATSSAPAGTTHKSAASSARATTAHSTGHATSGATNKTRVPASANVKYARARHGRGGRVSSHAAPAPSYQLHPDPERYQQIQQALADRGYFKGEVNGQWGDDSVDALKRFQADQKLDDDGHLSALTLTGLGLGPRHDHDFSSPPNPGSVAAPPSAINGSAPKPALAPPSTAPPTAPGPTGPPPPPDASAQTKRQI